MNQMVDGLKEVASQTRGATESLNAATAEMMASTQQQANSTAEQSSAVQETTATVEEISRTEFAPAAGIPEQQPAPEPVIEKLAAGKPLVFD